MTAHPRTEGPMELKRPVRERVFGVGPGVSTAPWFFEATLKQEIQRRKQRGWRAASFFRTVTRVILPGSMIVVVVLCGILALL
jgi:hypothetical protein